MDLGHAAMRHRRCAEHLSQARETGEACYLIGLAAECAVKHHLQSIGFPLRRSRRAKKGESTPRDPLYLHFPDLAIEVQAQASGMLAGQFMARLTDQSLLSGWNVKLRYKNHASTPSTNRTYQQWHQQTSALFRECELI